MKDMIKNIKIAFSVDKVKYNEVDKILKNLSNDVELVNDKDVKELEALMQKFKDNSFKIDTEDAKDVMKRLESLRRKGILSKEDLKPFKKESGLEQFSKGFTDQLKIDFLPKLTASDLGMKSAEFLKKGFDTAISALATVFKESFEKLNNLISYSRLTNQTTRENLFQYGMTASETYGLERAMTLVGITDIEDVIWLQADQQKAFQDKLLKETERYQKLYDSGYFQKMQQFQWDMANFRDDLEYEFMDFFVENKELIMDLLKIVADSAQTGVKLLGAIANGLIGPQTISDAERSAQTKELFYGKGSNLSVNIDNTFNNVAKSDQTWLANAGEMTYEQLIRVLQKGA